MGQPILAADLEAIARKLSELSIAKFDGEQSLPGPMKHADEAEAASIG
jgi:hypothetical protein